MKKIVTMLQPFLINQTVIVYEDGNKISSASIKTTDFANEVCKMAKTFAVQEVNLGGAKQYAHGIGKQIQEMAATQYNLEDLKIMYI